MGSTATLLSDGKRLHLQHGPIDLVIGADGTRDTAFEAARDRFNTILDELVAELPELRATISPLSRRPNGAVARRMHDAAMQFRKSGYLTRMAAVAGSVADEVLRAMTDATELRRAYVNNGGDIAFHLEGSERFTAAMMNHNGRLLGQITVTTKDAVRGIATSGRHGRSLSLGIADSVTVLASSAAEADVAATLIANAINLPDHPAIKRRPASEIDDDSDLGDIPVVIECNALSQSDCADALKSGYDRAMSYVQHTSISGAALFLQDYAVVSKGHLLSIQNKEEHYA